MPAARLRGHSRAEIAAALQLSEERLVARQLAEEELRRTRAQCGGKQEVEAAGYLQQAALQLLDIVLSVVHLQCYLIGSDST